MEKEFIENVIKQKDPFVKKENESKIKEFTQNFINLIENYDNKHREEVLKYLERVNLANKDFTITSRGELPPLITAVQENHKPNFIVPWIISFKNYVKLGTEHYDLVLNKTLNRLLRAPEDLELISVDEMVTGASLEMRIRMLRDIYRIEKEFNKKTGKNLRFFPYIEIINFVSDLYQDEDYDPLLARDYRKQREKNLKKIDAYLNELNENEPRVGVSYIFVEKAVPWQDNDDFYRDLVTTYLPFPHINKEALEGAFRVKYGKEYKKALNNFYQELIDKHREITQKVLSKLTSFVGINGLYAIGEGLINENYGSWSNFLRSYLKESMKATYELVQKYGLNYEIREDELIIGKKKRKKEGFIYKPIFTWEDLSDLNVENKNSKSALRLLVGFKNVY